jgi:CRP/FNR family cyclic AMP-dependent transcriptional regulator
MELEDEKTLAGIEMFADLDPEERRRIEAWCRWRRYRNNERIIERGSESREVFFIIKGAVNVVDLSLSGREIAFAKVYEGDSFGELAAIDGQPRSASVIAAENTLIAVLSADRFLDILQNQVAVTFKVLQRLALMVREGDIRIMELSTLAATQRVYSEILRRARPDAAVRGLWIVRPLPPLREIASRVSTTRETVARALSQLYPTELVRRKGRNLYLMDRKKLEELVISMQLESGNRH